MYPPMTSGGGHWNRWTYDFQAGGMHSTGQTNLEGGGGACRMEFCFQVVFYCGDSGVGDGEICDC